MVKCGVFKKVGYFKPADFWEWRGRGCALEEGIAAGWFQPVSALLLFVQHYRHLSGSVWNRKRRLTGAAAATAAATTAPAATHHFFIGTIFHRN